MTSGSAHSLLSLTDEDLEDLIGDIDVSEYVLAEALAIEYDDPAENEVPVAVPSGWLMAWEMRRDQERHRRQWARARAFDHAAGDYGDPVDDDYDFRC